MSILGKRQRATAPEAPPADADSYEEIMRRHFEAQFKPLQIKTKKPKKVVVEEVEEVEVEEEEEPEDEWDGLSEEDDNENDDNDDDDDGGASDASANDTPSNTVQVVDHSKPSLPKDLDSMTKQERKVFLSSRPPSAIDEPKDNDDQQKSRRKKKNSKGDPESAPELLANDLALQRLIAESHLLASTRVASMTAAEDLKSNQPFAMGRLRHKALEMRLQAATAASGGAGNTGRVFVGGRRSTEPTQKMPMNMRKGIVAAAASREAKRRQEAKDGGIILERPAAAAATSASAKRAAAERKRGPRAVDLPAVGKLRGSQLRLTDRDVRAIEGPRKNTQGGKRKKRR